MNKLAIILGNTAGFIDNWYNIAYKPFLEHIFVDKIHDYVVDVYYFVEMPSLFLDLSCISMTIDMSKMPVLDFSGYETVYNFGTPTPIDFQMYTGNLKDLDSLFPRLVNAFEQCETPCITISIDPEQLNPSKLGHTIHFEPTKDRLVQKTIDGRHVNFVSLSNWVDSQCLLHGEKVLERILMFNNNIVANNESKEGHIFYGIYSNLHNRQNDTCLRDTIDSLNNLSTKNYLLIRWPKETVTAKQYEYELFKSMFTLIARPPLDTDSCSVNRIWQALANYCIPVYTDNTKHSDNPIFDWMPTAEEIEKLRIREYKNGLSYEGIMTKLYHKFLARLTTKAEDIRQSIANENGKLSFYMSNKSVKPAKVISTDALRVKEQVNSDSIDIDNVMKSFNELFEHNWQVNREHFVMEPKADQLLHKLHDYVCQANQAYVNSGRNVKLTGRDSIGDRLTSLIISTMSICKYLDIDLPTFIAAKYQTSKTEK